MFHRSGTVAVQSLELAREQSPVQELPEEDARFRN
jgi:hypothetical protein